MLSDQERQSTLEPERGEPLRLIKPSGQPTAAPGHQSRLLWWVGLAVVMLLGSLYTYYFLDRGWIPHDEGMLAQTAERVLGGELPHRDFADPYTGALAYLNALGFKVFGTSLLAIRYTLFVAFLLWLPLLYYAATRLASPLAATVACLTAVFWSVPNYPAGMPSWYNLFLATAGIAAFLAYIDSGWRGWIVAAGLSAGLSFLFKTTGVFLAGAGVLFLLYHESKHDGGADKASTPWHVAVAAPMVLAALALLAIGFSRRYWVDFYQFAIPGLAMVAAVAWLVFRARPLTEPSTRRITRSVLLFGLGVAIPVAAFMAHYAASGALWDLVQGVVVLPARRLDNASFLPPWPRALLSLVFVALIVFDLGLPKKAFAIVQYAIAIGLAFILFSSTTAIIHERKIWASLAQATPAVVVALALLAVRTRRQGVPRLHDSRVVLVGCVVALCSLVQYPFAAPIYFAYSLPLLLLAALALLAEAPKVSMNGLRIVSAFYLVYGALYVTPVRETGLFGPMRNEDVGVLNLPRGGLTIGRIDADLYPQAIQVLQSRAVSGTIYAGPDAPEVYFLANLKNPTPAIFDFLVPDTLFHERLVQQFDSLGIAAIALRKHVVHSSPLEPAVQSALETRLPHALDIGRFTLRWKE